MKPENNTNADFCVCCGEIVPEGRMVCLSCEMNWKPVAPFTRIKLVENLKKQFDFFKESKNEP